VAGLNFYTDNADLQFQLEHRIDWDRIVPLREDVGGSGCPYGSVREAVEAYLDTLKDPVGELAASRIAPRAAEIDQMGCVLKDGEVRLADGMLQNLKDLADTDLMAMTLPARYGGLNFPSVVYTAATEIISRADSSLMNLFSLQGIAETIHLFASDEIKEKYLPRLASGELSGAMVLTEPDCGSDLLSIQTMACLDEPSGRWTLKGTKRFITNGCGDVLLVLARSEDPKKYSGGRGLSLFLVEKSDAVAVRRVEHKLGICGSPTCELHFNDAPALLIGDRGKGLTRYVNWLMNAARVSVAAQAVGIAEAAFREARTYAEQREQFGRKINTFAPVAEMLVDMRVGVEAARSLLYSAAQVAELADCYEARLARTARDHPDYSELRRQQARYASLAEVLTPLVKYYAAEMSIRVTSDALQIHGGTGYMKDCPVERLYRDARITSIYEGTSQIQIDRAVGKLVKGALDESLAHKATQDYPARGSQELATLIDSARRSFLESVEYVRNKKLPNAETGRGEADSEYRSLVGRRLADMASDVYLSYLLLEEAQLSEHKMAVAMRFIRQMSPRVEMYARVAASGDRFALSEFDRLVYGDR